MERGKLRRTALFSSKYLLVSPSMERLNDFEAEHSHPRPTHMHVHPPVPPSPSLSQQRRGIAQGWPEPTAACWGSDLYLWGSSTKLSQKLVVNLCWCPVPRSFFSLWAGFAMNTEQAFQTARGGDKHLGNSWRWPTSRRQHRQRSLKCRGRWCSVSQILTSLFLKISLKVSRLRLYSFLNEYIKTLP